MGRILRFGRGKVHFLALILRDGVKAMKASSTFVLISSSDFANTITPTEEAHGSLQSSPLSAPPATSSLAASPGQILLVEYSILLVLIAAPKLALGIGQ